MGDRQAVGCVVRPSPRTGHPPAQSSCPGAPFRDVNGDGITGFGPGVPDATRTRDELSARIDLANLARADLFISLHINSMTQNGVVYKTPNGTPAM